VAHNTAPLSDCVANIEEQIRKETVNTKYELFSELGEYLAEKVTQPEEIEGHSAFYLEKSKLRHSLASDVRVSTVCKVGFNAGHSTIGWLIANPSAFVFAFDIGYHDFTAHALDFILVRFPGRALLNTGASIDTIRTWLKLHPTQVSVRTWLKLQP
jgi:hypothetical protein